MPVRCTVGSCAASQRNLYFAYGANLNAAVLRRRDVSPLDSFPAKALDSSVWLSFRHRAGYATLIFGDAPPTGSNAADICQPHGLLYLITDSDLVKLVRSEGGYVTRSVRLQLYGHAGKSGHGAGDAPEGWATDVQALTFVSDRFNLLPSSVPPPERYLKKIVQGAKAAALDPEYVQRLVKVQAAQADGRGLAREYYDTLGNQIGQLLLATAVTGAAGWFVTQL